MSRTATFPWFARHELSLSWRDLYAMLSANKPGKGWKILAVCFAAMAVMHLLAYGALRDVIEAGIRTDHASMILVSGLLLLPVSLMASQAMESITRSFYARSDLELILSSPAPARRVFMVRMLAIAFATTSLTLLVCAPVFNTLAWFYNPSFLLGYFVVAALGLFASGTAILLTLGLFAIAGPRRTRTISQILAALVGAGFVVGVQLLAIASIGSISRIRFFQSDELASMLPESGSLLYLPAIGATGDAIAAFSVFAAAAAYYLGIVFLLSGSFGNAVLRAASIDITSRGNSHSSVRFKGGGAAAVLRRKEWKILLRDKWLISQTLMQLFYLVPPAFMLWQGFGHGQAPQFVIVPVIVMAAGQLAGGLAWLAISGEDAPELVATAPVTRRAVIRAKVEAVLLGTGVLVMPLVIALAFISLRSAVIAAVVLAFAILCSTMIQLWFRSQAKRSNFRRRQTSSRVATIAEAFSSILWAGAAGIAITGSPLVTIPVVIIALLLLGVYKLRPQHEI